MSVSPQKPAGRILGQERMDYPASLTFFGNGDDLSGRGRIPLDVPHLVYRLGERLKPLIKIKSYSTRKQFF